MTFAKSFSSWTDPVALESVDTGAPFLRSAQDIDFLDVDFIPRACERAEVVHISTGCSINTHSPWLYHYLGPQILWTCLSYLARRASMAWNAL